MRKFLFNARYFAERGHSPIYRIGNSLTGIRIFWRAKNWHHDFYGFTDYLDSKFECPLFDSMRERDDFNLG